MKRSHFLAQRRSKRTSASYSGSPKIGSSGFLSRRLGCNTLLPNTVASFFLRHRRSVLLVRFFVSGRFIGWDRLLDGGFLDR